MNASEDALAGILAEHRQEHRPDTGASRCSCGEWEGPFTILPASDMRSFAHHVAQVLAEWVAEQQAEALEAVCKEWQFGGWTILTAPPPAGAIPSQALGQRVTDWLRDRADRLDAEETP